MSALTNGGDVVVRTPARATLLAALLAGAVGVVISSIAIGVPSAWGDEAISLMSAQRSLPSLAAVLVHVDAVHGVYYALLHLWLALFGVDPGTARLLSAVAVGAAASGIVVLGARWRGLSWGVLSAVVFLALPRTALLGAEARSYALSAACAVWFVVLVLEVVGQRGRRWHVLLVLAAAAAIAVFVYTALLLAVWLVVARRRGALRRELVGPVLAALLASPVLVLALAQRGQVGWVNETTLPWWQRAFVDPWFVTAPWSALGWTGLLAASVLLAVGAVRARVLPDAAVLAVATWVVVPAAVLLVLTAAVPAFAPRYLSFAAPGVALAIGGVLAAVAERSRIVAAVALVALVALAVPPFVASRQPHAKDGSDWADVAAAIGASARPGDGMLFDEAAPTPRLPRELAYAYPRDVAGLVDLGVLVDYRDSDQLRGTAVEGVTLRQRLLAAPDRVWYVAYLEPEAADLGALESAGYRIAGERPFERDTLVEFVRP